MVVDIDGLYLRHPDAVEHLHRLDVVATEIETMEVFELNLLNRAEDLLVEEVYHISHLLPMERVLIPHCLMWGNS